MVLDTLEVRSSHSLLFHSFKLQSERNLRVSGGQELSRGQLVSFQSHDDDEDDYLEEDDDDNRSTGIVDDKEADKGDVEEAQEEQDVVSDVKETHGQYSPADDDGAVPEEKKEEPQVGDVSNGRGDANDGKATASPEQSQ